MIINLKQKIDQIIVNQEIEKIVKRLDRIALIIGHLVMTEKKDYDTATMKLLDFYMNDYVNNKLILKSLIRQR